MQVYFQGICDLHKPLCPLDTPQLRSHSTKSKKTFELNSNGTTHKKFLYFDFKPFIQKEIIGASLFVPLGSFPINGLNPLNGQTMAAFGVVLWREGGGGAVDEVRDARGVEGERRRRKEWRGSCGGAVCREPPEGRGGGVGGEERGWLSGGGGEWGGGRAGEGAAPGQRRGGGRRGRRRGGGGGVERLGRVGTAGKSDRGRQVLELGDLVTHSMEDVTPRFKIPCQKP